MQRLANPLSVIVLVLGLALLGCGSTKPTSTESTHSNMHEDHGGHEHAGHAEGDHTSADAPSDDVVTAMADLSPDDRALAESQKICPVSGEPLGAMGVPIKVDVNGRSVFICCEGCREELLAKPDEYLAKLQK